MRSSNAARRLKKLPLIGALCLTLSASACVPSEGTTGIDFAGWLGLIFGGGNSTPAPSETAEEPSLCSILSRQELQSSRRDTPETQDQLSGAIEKYDAACP